MNKEEWRPVPQFEGYYEVSSQGRVRAIARSIIDSNGHKRSYKERILKQDTDKDGYKKVRLSMGDSQKRLSVHHIVLFTHTGARPSGHIGMHVDGDPSNNTPGNLKWGTPLENKRDQILHGTWGRKLSEETARDILSLRGVVSMSSCGMLYDIASSHVCRIWNRKVWSWL